MEEPASISPLRQPLTERDPQHPSGTGASMSSGESHDNTRALARRGRGKDRRGVGENELIENFNQVTDGGVFEAFRL